jgi:hypothetical protein
MRNRPATIRKIGKPIAGGNQLFSHPGSGSGIEGSQLIEHARHSPQRRTRPNHPTVRRTVAEAPRPCPA